MPEASEQSFACKEEGCKGTVTYHRVTVTAYRGVAKAPAAPEQGRIIRVYLKCEPNGHEHEYAARV
jgi:hypothetical protein